jgi:hypothetical protein
MAEDTIPPGDRDNLSGDHWEEFVSTDPQYRRLHRGVRLSPEEVWGQLRTYLCADDHDPLDLQYVDLVEDLMFWHAATFVGRIEALVAECPLVGQTIAWAHVGGTVAPGVEQFHKLQERVLRELEEQGIIELG